MTLIYWNDWWQIVSSKPQIIISISVYGNNNDKNENSISNIVHSKIKLNLNGYMFYYLDIYY